VIPVFRCNFIPRIAIWPDKVVGSKIIPTEGSYCSLWNKLHASVWLRLVNDEIDKESFGDVDTLFIVILYVITNQ
jgi:hypothetical protein